MGRQLGYPELSMETLNSRGFDAAQVDHREDDLNRWRFAAEIVELVLDTAPDWSVRIGIFGKWGEGKSTVLRFAEVMLRQRDSIVFSFSPWAVQNWNDLWEEFGKSLIDALTSAKIPVEDGVKSKVKKVSGAMKSKGADKLAQGALAILGRDKVYEATFGAVGQWLKYDGPQIKTIRSKLQSRRIVVLIDDLDRCAPELLPRLLLSLRELLDLPGFSFLLAFDNEIIADSLLKVNPAWANGSSFLEKILDFQFHLPAITNAQKYRLISRAITRHCPFVPNESVNSILDLLPNNPRKLKSLIRSMTALKSEILRHDSDELNWTDMWLAQMLKLESYSFYELLLSANHLEDEVGQSYRIQQSMSRHSIDSGNEDKRKNLRDLFKDADITDPLLTKRLIQLIEACRARASNKFVYICQMAMHPHAVTWKEFHQCFAFWVVDRSAVTLSTWIGHHAETRDVSIDDVEEELFDTFIRRRQDCLSSAAESSSLEDLNSFTQEADKLLELIEQDLLSLGKLNVSRLQKVFGQISYWIAFRRNPSDKLLREREESSLLNILKAASGLLSAELLEVFLPQHYYPELGEGVAERKALRAKCMDILAPLAARETLNFLTRPGGIQSLAEQGRFTGIKYCLLNLESPMWKEPLYSELLDLLNRGQKEPVIFENACNLLNFLLKEQVPDIGPIPSRNVKTVLSNETLARSLWKTVTSKGIQYRMRINFIRVREALLQIGIPESSLPLNEELAARLKEQNPG